MSKIAFISNVIDTYFKEDEITVLKEDQANMKIDFVSDKQKFLSFTFDRKLKKTDFPKGFFTFFNRGEAKVTSFCDYIIFSERDKNLFILLIELKKGNDNVTEQLFAGKCFAEYVISTVNRVYNMNINPEYRLISIRQRHIKPKQKQKEIEYINNFHTFCSSKFWLKSYLK
jgi:hypothetical protein